MGRIRTGLAGGARGAVAAAALVALLLGCGGSGDGQELGRPAPELQRKIEELIPRLESLSHLEAFRTPVARRSSSQDLEAYLLERLEAEFPGDTLERLGAAYAAFGLLPDTLDLRGLLVDLMLEQAVGYYDPVRDVFFVKEDAPEDLVDAVLAHELVHALQDQLLDLDSLMHSVDGNDARTAIQSAIEGQATLVMLAFQMREATGQDVDPVDLPELSPGMMDAMAAASAFRELARAPAIVQRPLLFAYVGGARYVQRLWRSRPEEPPPFGSWLPESTEQLLHTAKILENRDTPIELRLGEPPAGWRLVYGSDLGELEAQIYFGQHLGDRAAAVRAAAGWDGDAYALLERDGARALVWYTAWDSAADADEFVEAYRRAFRSRFGGSSNGEELVGRDRQARVERFSEGEVELVRVVEGSELPAWPGVQLNPTPDAAAGHGSTSQ